MMRWVEDLTGHRFGRTVVVKRVKSHPRGGARWLCKCDCGKEHIAGAGHLRHGNTKSCGCFRREFAKEQHTTHGMWGTPTRASWGSMKGRCFNPNSDDWEGYGGRGITVCARWMKFENFLEDMGIAPLGMTIDRIDNDDNYYKENCRWASQKQQVRNTRASKLTLLKAVEVIKQIESGVTYKQVCRNFGIKSTGHVYLIVKGKMWPEARRMVDAGV